jgi:transcriptional regulator with XRE-family HTH domain
VVTWLGDKLRKGRQDKGYSLDKLAEITGSSKSYLWELENRETRKPSAEKLTTIASALDLTTDYLLDEGTSAPDDEVFKNALFRNFKKLNPEDQKAIRETIERWGKKK